MRTTRLAILGLALLSGIAAGPALAVDLSNAGLSNITIGAQPTGGNRGNASLTNSTSLSGSVIGATTTSSTTFGSGTALATGTGTGGNGITNGGTASGFTETTALRAGGEAIANTSLQGNGGIYVNYNAQQVTGLNSTTGQTQNGSTTNLNANGVLTGSFQRTANSNAATGLNGYSGAQMTQGPGSVTNSTYGSAFGAGASVSGAAGLR